MSVRQDLASIAHGKEDSKEPSHTIETFQDSIDEIFAKLAQSSVSTKDEDPQSFDRIYPELVLQIPELKHSNKYIASFQRHHRQFIDSSGEAAIIRWRNSNIESLQGSIIEKSFLGGKDGEIGSNGAGDRRKSYTRPTSSALFSWSSNDAYIERRRRELYLKGRKVGGPLPAASQENNNGDADSTKDKPQTLIEKVNIKLPDEHTTNKLSYLIESESNKFIHNRIQVIKHHHSEQISKKINERKRKDHELHLQRLKMKEEQYERELRAATEEKEKSNRFLGIFNFNTTEHNSVVDSTDKLEESDKNGTVSTNDSKKRFSFLPKTNLFGSSKERPDASQEDTKEGKEEKDSEKDVERESEENVQKEKVVEEPVVEEPITEEPELKLNSEDLDSVFKIENTTKKSNDLDEFEEFQSSPSPKPKPEEKIITSHRFLPMSEPTPLINLDNEESMNTSSANVSRTNTGPTDNDNSKHEDNLLIL